MEEASFLRETDEFANRAKNFRGPNFDCIEERQLLQIRNKQVPASVSDLLWILSLHFDLKNWEIAIIGRDLRCAEVHFYHNMDSRDPNHKHDVDLHQTTFLIWYPSLK